VVRVISKDKHMTEIEWQPLPTPMWPSPAVFTDVGDFELLVFTDNGVPTWEVYKRIEGSRDRDLITRGTADTFEAAQAAALFEVVAARPSE
jgi:hypothetical protein